MATQVDTFRVSRAAASPVAPVQPTGTGITRIQDIAGGLIAARSTRVSFPAGTTVIGSDFITPSVYPVYSVYLDPSVSELLGTGTRQSLLEVAANSMSAGSAAKIPAQSAGGTNPLWVLRVNGTTKLTNIGFHRTGQTVSAADQMYNGVEFYQQTGITHDGILFKGFVGNNSANPGEIFGLADYRGVGNTYRNLEGDGRNDVGTAVAATHLGLNFVNGVTVTDSNFHDTAYGYAIATYQSTGSLNFTNCIGSNCLVPFNFERNVATIAMRNCTYTGSYRSSEPPAHIIIDSDLGSSRIDIYDPVFDNLSGHTGKFVAQVHNTYGGKPQKQLVSDIHIWQSGVEVTGTILDVIH